MILTCEYLTITGTCRPYRRYLVTVTVLLLLPDLARRPAGPLNSAPNFGH